MRDLPDRKRLYEENLSQFLDSWADPGNHQRLTGPLNDEMFRLNLERAMTAVIWIRRWLGARAQARQAQKPEIRRPPTKRTWFRARS